ncbi:hypothetical protein [Siphonobacter aquaeclarae]|jgi:hypothetical protein|uniref:Lipocalin-like domain-containing protein n=1 Tax=Siphonobacter aquaeclarae TaxID=563176 RepID=A0A1G9JVF9_9BACT|nr:hypothetical protein [Siphonobacter aquaeclarae]SDL40823.1 hypothetical protein SAMN04488090_0754 [Siphonobacter aquaeclarae]
MIQKISTGFLVLVVLFLASCGKDKDLTKSEVLVSTSWKLSRVSNPSDGKTIDQSRLGATTVSIFQMNIQFRDNNIVRAMGPDNQILNAGTWQLSSDQTVMTVDITAFKGDFKVVELKKGSLILQQSGVPVDGKNQSANLEFVAL